jgi:hypothetical protein
MVDFLDEAAPAVQPEVFRQGTVAPEPEPEPAPAPAAPEEPEAPPVEPDWLSAPAPAPVQQQAPQQQQREYYPPQQQQPQYAPAPVKKGDLNAFIEDPDGYIDRLVAQRLDYINQQALMPLMYQQQQMAQEFQGIRQNNQKSALSQADNAIKNAYREFNKDSAFRSNPRLQERIKGALAGLRESALMEAQRGNYGPLSNLANLGEAEARATLAAARVIEGIGSPGSGPLQVQGATVESSRAAVDTSNIELTAEQQEIARRFGGQEKNYAERMRKAIADQRKYDDFEG